MPKAYEYRCSPQSKIVNVETVDVGFGPRLEMKRGDAHRFASHSPPTDGSS